MFIMNTEYVPLFQAPQKVWRICQMFFFICFASSFLFLTSVLQTHQEQSEEEATSISPAFTLSCGGIFRIVYENFGKSYEISYLATLCFQLHVLPNFQPFWSKTPFLEVKLFSKSTKIKYNFCFKANIN